MSEKRKETSSPSGDHRAGTGRPATQDGIWPVHVDLVAGDPAAAMRAEVELAMNDLIGDENGEIVFYNDSGFRRLAIATDATVQAEGQVGKHRTASGQDVSGFGFLSFNNGLTLYYQSGLDVVVRAAG
ncbi:MAG: hypothetical protein AAF637_06820 [Pseudomonadota bacterium]